MRAITERSAVELAAAIRTGELRASDVVEAHIEMQQRTAAAINAVVADRYETARHEAMVVDELVRGAKPDAVLPPFLGVPFTVKESIAVAGMPQSAGVFARRDYRATRTAPPVKRLVDAGAIPLGVTNTSELTLWVESVNRVYGRTSNPYDPRRVAGGSSGGEGAVVGAGGSPFGLGSDIGGSIRFPALFCGVFGHKPSSGLVPVTANWPPSTSENARMLGIGPIARRAEDLMPVLRVIAGPDGEDSFAREMALGDPGSVSLDGLRVVLPEKTSRWPVSREVHDARERAAGALAAAGATLERVALPSWRDALMPFLTTLDAGADQSTLELLRETGADPRWGQVIRPGGPYTLPTKLVLAPELLRMSRRESRGAARMLERARALAAEVIEVIGDGVVLHSGHPRIPPRHGGTLGRPWLLNPMIVFNLSGVPVTEVPLGLSVEGLPLGVQVAAGMGQDHVSIAVALELERVFGGWRAPPNPPPV